jgi:hypothetical protein
VTRRTIRASELGAYLFCRRAWWYQKSGLPSQNTTELAAGSELHYRHGRLALRLGCLRFAAYGLLLLGLALLAVYWVQGVF